MRQGSAAAPVPTEHQNQSAVVEWARLQACAYPCLAYLYAIPNGGFRNKIEASRLKAEGVRAGVPDLCLPYPHAGYHGLYIEMKKLDGKLDPKQRDFISFLRLHGYKVCVCKSVDEGIEAIKRYLAA